jgi:hypothetical protein
MILFFIKADHFMPEPLSSKTIKKLNAASDALSQKHHLDANACAELRSRMETNLLAYLSGEEKLTEEDAFFLVREHFGDPEVIRAMLLNVHRAEAVTSLVRRIAAVLVLTLAAGLAGYCLQLIFRIGSLVAFGSAGMFRHWKESVGILCEAALFTVVLVHWRKRTDREEKPWFQTAGPLAFVLIIAALLCLDTLIPFLVCLDPAHLLNIPRYMLSELHRGYSISGGHHTDPYWLVQLLLKPMHPPTFGSIFYSLLALAYLVFQCALWLWWCDAPPRRFNGMVIAIGAWAFYSFIITWFQPKPIFQWDRTGQVFFRTMWYQTVWNVSGWLFVYLMLIVLASVMYISTGFFSSRRDKYRMEDTGNHISAA